MQDSRIAKMCVEKGLKMTEPRKVIARVLSDATDHPDVEALHRRVRDLDPSISIATVYRTMKLFEDTNIVSKRDFGDGRARYEEIQGDEDHHHHLIDVRTGEVIEFYNEELENLKVKIANELGYELVIGCCCSLNGNTAQFNVSRQVKPKQGGTPKTSPCSFGKSC